MGQYVMPRAFSVEALTASFAAAKQAAKPDALSAGGWVRLALCDSMSGGKPYAVACRSLKDGRIQFGCSCKHWIYRCQTTGQLCKHQQAVLCGGLTPMTESGSVGIKWYQSGETFLSVLAQKVLDARVNRHVASQKKAA